MPSEVRHLVDGGQTYPVVRLAGVLDAVTAPLVRSVLLDVLAGQPEAVVVDVADLSVRDPAAVAVLNELAAEVVDWPGSRLVLCAIPEGGSWSGTGLPVLPTPADAFTALGAPAPGHFLNLAMEPQVGAARRSRELVSEACGRWRLPELAGPACTVVTEMVNNVVAHARTPMTVLLGLHGNAVTVAVRDHSAGVPRFTGDPVPVTSYGGRGLLLIDSMSRRWGSLALADGKVVWAVLDGEHEQPTEVSSTGMAGHRRG
ncbi:ATP-binding protein [Actinoplanes sp. NPDC026623]|uniref:ATP-binding protein n=1 Tax=Actinoplanes sp. NPDC026623 TaxID=3155610 RepID=UPI0033E2DED5